MKLLLLVEFHLHPEPRSVREEILGEGQRALHIELILGRATQLHLGEGELLAQLVALPLVGLSVDRSFVSRIVKLGLNAAELPTLDAQFDEITEGEELSKKAQLRTK